MKFGGTSVANFEAITRTIFIIGGRLDKKPVVVVSALSKITDLLYGISDAAASKNLTQTRELLGQLRKRHVDLASELLCQHGSSGFGAGQVHGLLQGNRLGSAGNALFHNAVVGSENQQFFLFNFIMYLACDASQLNRKFFQLTQAAGWLGKLCLSFAGSIHGA